MAACIFLTFAACDKFENEVLDNNGNFPGADELPDIFPDGNKESASLSITQQKAKLDTVARAFMDKLNADDFQTYSDILGAFEEGFFGNSEEYDWSALYERLNEDYSKIFQPAEEEILKNGTQKYVYTTLVLLSNHKGLITIGETAATISDYDGTKVVTTVNGKTYAAELKQKGKVTKALFSYESYRDYRECIYDYDEETGAEQSFIQEGKIQEIYNFTIGFPEELEIAITEDGKPLATLNCKFTPSINGNKFVLTKDAFSMDVTMAMNGYEILVENSGYNGATDTAMMSYMLKKDGDALITAAAYGNVDLAEDTYEFEYTYGENNEFYEKGKETVIKCKSAGSVNFAMDIMQKIQIAGKCSDYDEFAKAVENFYNAENDTDRQRYLANINAKVNLGVYYDLGSNKQASLVFKQTYNPVEWGEDYEHYGLTMMIEFNDGSIYTFDEFFSDNIFEALMESVSGFSDSWEKVFGFEMESEDIITGTDNSPVEEF